jgi:hypothetical protein
MTPITTVFVALPQHDKDLYAVTDQPEYDATAIRSDDPATSGLPWRSWVSGTMFDAPQDPRTADYVHGRFG